MSVIGAGASLADPLASLTLDVRLQTHLGDGVPHGMYQDAAATIPADTAGDLVYLWRDEINSTGLQLVQATSSNRPVLQFDGGLPYLDCTGGKNMISSSVLTSYGFGRTAAIVMKVLSADTNKYDCSMGHNNCAFMHGYSTLQGGNIIWYLYPTLVDLGDVDESWQAISVQGREVRNGLVSIASTTTGGSLSSGKYKALISGLDADATAIADFIATL
jgi:hypothetical protein